MKLRLKSSKLLNFYINKFNNIRRKRVINILIYALSNYNIDKDYFYINSKTNNAKIINIVI